MRIILVHEWVTLTIGRHDGQHLAAPRLQGDTVQEVSPPALALGLVHQPSDLQVGALVSAHPATHLVRPGVVAGEELVVEHGRLPVRRPVWRWLFGTNIGLVRVTAGG